MVQNINDILKSLNEIQQNLAADGVEDYNNERRLNKLINVLGDNHNKNIDPDVVRLSYDDKSVEESIEYLLSLVDSSDIQASNAASLILNEFGENIIEYVGGVLQSKNKAKRLFGVKVIGKIGSDKGLPLLFDLLEYENEEIVFDAIFEALGAIGSKDAIPILLKQLNLARNYPWRQFPIVYSLIKIADESIIDVMLKLILDEVMHPLAVECLGVIGDPSVIMPLFNLLPKELNNFSNFLKIVSALQKIERKTLNSSQYQKDETVFIFMEEKFRSLNNSKIIEAITNNISAQKYEDQLALIWMLKRMGKSFDPCLILGLLSKNDSNELIDAITDLFLSMPDNLSGFFISRLSDGSVPEKLVAMKYLFFTPDETVLNLLCGLAFHIDKRVKIQTAKSFGVYSGEKVVNSLFEMLKDEDHDVVDAVIGAIAVNGGTEIIDKIKPIIKKQPEHIKKNMLSVLSIIDSPNLYEEVLVCLDDQSPLVKAEALKVLRNIHSRFSFEFDTAFLKKLKNMVHDESLRVKKEAVKSIAALYNDNPDTVKFFQILVYQEDIWTRYYALKELVHTRKKYASPIILNNFTIDTPVEILIKYCGLIVEAPDKSFIPVLTQIMDFPDPCLQSAIVSTLGKLKYPSTLNAVINKCGSNNLSVKTAAIRALAMFSSPQVEDVLINVLRDAYETINEDCSDSYCLIAKAAIQSFGESNSCRKIEELIPFFKYEKFVPDIYRAFMLKKSLIFTRIDTFLTSGDPSIRRCIAIILSEIKNEQSLKILKLLLKDRYSSVRRSAIMSLGKIKSEQALLALKSVDTSNLPELEKYLINTSIDYMNNDNVKIKILNE